MAVGSYGSDNVFPELIIYEWNSSQLTVTTSKHYGKSNNFPTVNSLDWSPDGRFLALGGYLSSSDDAPELIIYEWDSSQLTVTTSKHYGIINDESAIYSVNWSPDGKFLAVAGLINTPDRVNPPLIIYEWNGSELTVTTSKHYGRIDLTTFIYSAAWSPNRKYLALGGELISDSVNPELIIYEWDGTDLTLTESKQYGKSDSSPSPFIRSVAWSNFGGYLALGGRSFQNTDVVIHRRSGLIDGVRKNISFNNTVPFNDFGMAIGDVTFHKGISVAANRSFESNFGTKILGELNLNDTGKIFLFGDLHLGTDISGGIIHGNGNTIFLEHHAMTFSQSVLTFSSDTIIDGQGNDFVLAHSSQLLVDTDVTLTLKNLKLKTTRNWRMFPALKLTDSSSRITFDNVEFAASDDFYFYNGCMYVHNDFVFTGTHSFIYKSDCPCFIEPKSTFHMEPETTFYYDTISSKNNNNELIVMQDKTSAIYLNGCTFMISNTGLRLTKGQLFFDNHVIIKNDTTPPPAFEQYFIWGDHTKGSAFDLDVFILAGANVDLQGYVYYDNAT